MPDTSFGAPVKKSAGGPPCKAATGYYQRCPTDAVFQFIAFAGIMKIAIYLSVIEYLIQGRPNGP